MTQSSMPNLPGADAMSETLEFVRNLWGGGMKIPGMTMPTMSIEEIEKQIADLKAVESWLTLNMNMLRGTIQALEVQSGTLSALKSMSDSMAAMVNPVAPAAGAAAPNFDFSAFVTPKPTASAAEPVTGAPAQENAGAGAAGQAASSDAATLAVTAAEDQTKDPTFSAGGSGMPTAPFADPAAWWNMLQSQFKQAVETAMAPVPTKTGKGARTASASKAAKVPSSPGSAKTPRTAGSVQAPRAASSGKLARASSAGKVTRAASVGKVTRAASALAKPKAAIKSQAGSKSATGVPAKRRTS